MSDTNPVVHFEMGYFDKARATKFYETVFGWKMNDMGAAMGDYVVAQTTDTDANGMVQTPGTINGGFYKKAGPSSLAPSIVVSVTDIQAAMKAVVDAGGKILGGMTADGQQTMEPQMIPGVGLWISAEDTEQNRFSILQASA